MRTSSSNRDDCISHAGLRLALMSMRRRPVLLLITVLWMSVCCAQANATVNKDPKILVLHSYHQGYLWTDMIQEGISRTLAGPFPKAELYIEYMNSKRQPADIMFPYLDNLYKHIYQKVKFDVIIASDNNALDFLLKYRDRLFPGTPVVFCGINDIFKYHFAPTSGYTGVSEDLDIVSTIAAALKLHPGTRKIALITDVTETGQINLGLARAAEKHFPNITFFELNKLTAAQLSARLRALPDDAIVLALSFFRDPEGATFTARESMDFIVNASRRPVYTVWDFYMAPGAVGGKLLSGRLQGESAANLAIRIIRGEKPSAIPIVDSPTAYMFDYEGLRKYDISESRLPQGSLVLGRPNTFYTRYKYYLWFGAALFITQALIISLLSWNIARRKREAAARHIAEKALAENENRLRTVVQTIPDLLWLKNVEGVYLSCNKEFEHVFGAPETDIVGKTDYDFVDKELADFFRKHDRKAMEAGKPCINEEWVTFADDGHHALLETIKTPMYDTAGNILGVLGIARDVTVRKEHEKELLKIEKLESLGALAGGIAHDFNNILTGIMGNISFAMMLLDPTHKAYTRLTEAEKASSRAAELARQLLTFARGGEPVKKVVSISQLVHESVSLLLRGSNVKGITDLPHALDAVRADEGQLSQVFNNIVMNAKQAMPDGGLLTVAALNETLTAKNPFALPAGRYVKLSFSDTGSGITPENMKRIFDPYFTTKTEGNGLGLASAYSIITRHGGNISAVSTVSQGTTFILYLPSTEETDTGRSGAAAGPRAAIDSRSGSILVMDDEELIRELSMNMLRHIGYEVKTCANGEETVALYKTAKQSGKPFAAVIMDLTIAGGMGGREAAQQILEIDPTACLIVSSGYSNDPIMSDYTAYGFRAAVAKPYTMEELTRLLDAIRSGGTPAR